MKKALFILLSCILCSFIQAQDVNFSGSWKLNSTKSKLNDQFSMAPHEIILAQDGVDFKVERHSSWQGQDFTTNDKFTLDGKECINPGWQDTQKKSTAVWSDDKKNLKVVTKFPMGDNGDMLITEVYKLTEPGVLTIESSASSSFGDSTEIMVFDKE